MFHQSDRFPDGFNRRPPHDIFECDWELIYAAQNLFIHYYHCEPRTCGYGACIG
jgi:hypothetical protein